LRPLDGRVALIVMSLEDAGTLFSAVGANYDGLIVAGFGAGHVPEALVEPLGALAQQMPVVLPRVPAPDRC
jgi:L-asparaginase